MTLEKLREIAFEHDLTLCFGTDQNHKGDKSIGVKTGRYKSDIDIETLKEIFDPVEIETLSIEDKVQFQLIIDEGEKNE